MGAALVGAIIETVSGESLPAYARRVVFDPLGMTRTSYWIADHCAPEEMARGCDVIDGSVVSADNGTQGQPESHPELASGVLRSTASDVARFLSLIAEGGATGGVRVLSEASAAELVRRQLPPDLPACADGRVVAENQAAMWIHFPYDGVDYIGHYGGIYGFLTAGYYRETDGLVVAILLNRIGPEAMSEIEVAVLEAVEDTSR